MVGARGTKRGTGAGVHDTQQPHKPVTHRSQFFSPSYKLHGPRTAVTNPSARDRPSDSPNDDEVTAMDTTLVHEGQDADGMDEYLSDSKLVSPAKPHQE
eukprot:jgi/Hompol1/7032/HPOL_002967-RA